MKDLDFQTRETLCRLQSDRYSLFPFPAFRGGSLCCCCFLMIYAASESSRNPFEGSQRDVFIKNTLKYSERVGRGNKQPGERDEKRTNTDRILHVCTRDSIFRCHPLFMGRLCETFTMKSISRSDVSVFESRRNSIPRG